MKSIYNYKQLWRDLGTGYKIQGLTNYINGNFINVAWHHKNKTKLNNHSCTLFLPLTIIFTSDLIQSILENSVLYFIINRRHMDQRWKYTQLSIKFCYFLTWNVSKRNVSFLLCYFNPLDLNVYQWRDLEALDLVATKKS